MERLKIKAAEQVSLDRMDFTHRERFYGLYLFYILFCLKQGIDRVVSGRTADQVSQTVIAFLNVEKICE